MSKNVTRIFRTVKLVIKKGSHYKLKKTEKDIVTSTAIENCMDWVTS